MKKTTTILAALSAGILAASAGTPAPAPAPVAVRSADPCAGPISYNSAEFLYAYTDYDYTSEHGSGGVFRLEYSAWDNFYIAAGASYVEAGGVDLWALSAGVGGYVPLSDNIHLVGEAGVLWSFWDGADFFVDDGSSAGTGYWDNNEEDDFGWYLRPHLRAKWGCFEVHAGALYTDAGGNWDDEWSVFANLYYQVAPAWDVTAGVTHNSDATTVTGGARYRY